MAEALLNAIGKSRFKAFSAGSSPIDNQQPNPLSLKVLQKVGIPTVGLHSKSWNVFAGPDAAQMNLIITLCDKAAGEVCPVWPGYPATAHWSYPDPSGGIGSEAEKLELFLKTLYAMKHRLELFSSLPDAKLEQALLQISARELANA